MGGAFHALRETALPRSRDPQLMHARAVYRFRLASSNYRNVVTMNEESRPIHEIIRIAYRSLELKMTYRELFSYLIHANNANSCCFSFFNFGMVSLFLILHMHKLFSTNMLLKFS